MKLTKFLILTVFLAGIVLFSVPKDSKSQAYIYEKTFNAFSGASDTVKGLNWLDGWEVEVTNANADSGRTFTIQGIQNYDGRTGYNLQLRPTSTSSKTLNDSLLTGSQFIPASTTKTFKLDQRSLYGFIFITEGRNTFYIRVKGVNAVRKD